MARVRWSLSAETLSSFGRAFRCVRLYYLGYVSLGTVFCLCRKTTDFCVGSVIPPLPPPPLSRASWQSNLFLGRADQEDARLTDTMCSRGLSLQPGGAVHDVHDRRNSTTTNGSCCCGAEQLVTIGGLGLWHWGRRHEKYIIA